MIEFANASNVFIKAVRASRPSDMPHEPMCITIDDEPSDLPSLGKRLAALHASARELRAEQAEMRAELEGVVSLLETMLAGPAPKRSKRLVKFKSEA